MKTRNGLVPMNEGDRATPFELFFDLVFVYAITQVTALMAHDPTVHGLLRGMLVLAILWWCWCGYAWLGNTIRLGDGIARAGLLVVMAAVFVIAQAVPEAFHDAPGGLPGPLVIAVAYFVVRLLHQLLYMHATWRDPSMRHQLMSNWIPWVGSVLLLTIAAFQHGWIATLFWAAALAWDYAFTLIFANRLGAWRISSVSHWTERHGLILIIALGESIVAIGIGAAGVPIAWPIVLAAVLGVAVASALWWVYFDVTSTAAEHRMLTLEPEPKARLASHAYTYLHLPLIAGVVLMALGIEEVLATSDHPGESLHGIGPFALFGGGAIYLGGHLGFGRRVFGTWQVSRLIATVVLLVLVPVGWLLPGLVSLALLALVLAATVGLEATGYAERRNPARERAHEQDPAGSEAATTSSETATSG